MNYCPHCGAKVEHDGKYCQACGKPLAVEAEAKPAFMQSFSQLKQLVPNHVNLNRVIRFMHANFFLIHAVYLVIFIITLISSWSGLWALLIAAIGIYLYGALHATDELEGNKQIKEMIRAVGENRPIDTKKGTMNPVQPTVNEEVVPEAEVYTEAPTTEPDTFDQLDVAANAVVDPENAPTSEPFEEDFGTDDVTRTAPNEPERLNTLESDVEADIEEALEEELDELTALNELEQVEEQATLDELEQMEDGDVIVAPEDEAEILLDNPEEKKR